MKAGCILSPAPYPVHKLQGKGPLVNSTGAHSRDTSHLLFNPPPPSVVPAALFVECLERRPVQPSPGRFPLINR